MRKIEAYNCIMRVADRQTKASKKVDFRRFWIGIMFWTNNYKRTLKYIDKRIGMVDEQSNIELCCWKGISYYFLEDYINALMAFERAEENDCRSPEIKFFLAKCYYARLELERAEAYYRYIMYDDELKTIGLYGYGCCMFRKNRFDEALAFFNRALNNSKTENRIDILNKKGLCLMEQEKLMEALSCFEECLDYSRNKRYIKANIALTLSKLGNYERASKYYKDLLKKIPYDIITINNLSLCLGAQGKYIEALKYCNLGLKIDPLNADLLSNRGCFLFYLGEYNNALECLSEAENSLKDDIGLLNNKALCLMNLKRCNEALKVFDQILLLGDNSNEVLLNRAYCLVKNEMYCEALKCLVKIEHEDEKLHDIFILQGICYEKLGDNVKAVESFNKALTSVG